MLYLLVLLDSLLLFGHLSLINTGVFIDYPAVDLVARVRHVGLECTGLNMFYLLFQVITLLGLHFPVLDGVYVTFVEVLHLLFRQGRLGFTDHSGIVMQISLLLHLFLLNHLCVIKRFPVIFHLFLLPSGYGIDLGLEGTLLFMYLFLEFVYILFLDLVAV